MQWLDERLAIVGHLAYEVGMRRAVPKREKTWACCVCVLLWRVPVLEEMDKYNFGLFPLILTYPFGLQVVEEAYYAGNIWASVSSRALPFGVV